MSGFHEIKYLPHQEIDKKKWDECIKSADNGLIYAYSFYLDMMAANWDALVWDDYHFVMPLPWKKKFTISYLYQPFLTAQLGIFGKGINPQMVEGFIHAIPAEFRLIEMPLNAGNHPAKHKHVIDRNNYVLDLRSAYENIYNQYNENTKRNIKKSAQAGSRIITDFDVEELISLAVGQMKEYEKESKDNVKRFRKSYEHLHHNNGACTYGVVSASEQLTAAAAFFKFHNRAYYILVGNHPESKAAGASHALIDGFIKDHAGQELVLDFEGSDIPGLAQFYSGFGAVNEKYPFLKINRLPFYLKWLKK